MHLPDNFSQAPPHAIAHDGFAKMFCRDKPIAVMRQFVGCQAERDRRMPKDTPLAPQTREICPTAQPPLPLHCLRRLVRLPVDLFDVTRLYRQFMTTTRAPTLEHFTSVFGMHPLAEPMHTRTAANLGLPGTLG